MGSRINQRNESATRSIAGCFRLLTLIQVLRPATIIGRSYRRVFEEGARVAEDASGGVVVNSLTSRNDGFSDAPIGVAEVFGAG